MIGSIGMRQAMGRLPGADARLPAAFDDAAAMARAAAGDGDAFEAIVRRHGRYVHHLASQLLADADDAEDAAQETFVRAWRARAGFRAEAGVRTWLYRIALNVCYDRLPRLRRELGTLDVDALGGDDGDGPADDGAPLDEGLGRAQLAAAVRAALDELPAGQRLLLSLRHFDDLSYDEIAQLTGLPLGTVKTGIHRARGRLRTRLAALADGDATAPAAAGRRAGHRGVDDGRG